MVDIVTSSDVGVDQVYKYYCNEVTDNKYQSLYKLLGILDDR